MSIDLIIASAFVVLIVVVHLASRLIQRLDPDKLAVAISTAGGVAAAYVFLHLLPELNRRATIINEQPAWSDQIVYAFALAGLVFFFALERLVLASQRADRSGQIVGDVRPSIFWLHLGAFAFHSFVIGHLLIRHDSYGPLYMSLYALALSVHLVAQDHALRRRHAKLHERHGRWLLAAAVLAGWATGLAGYIDDTLATIMFAFLAGGITFNVMKDELPQDKGGSFMAFLVGAGGYALLLGAASTLE